MTDRTKNIVVSALAAVFFLGFFAFSLLKPADSISLSERRPLAQLPELSFESLADGKYMSEFEKYSADQFPLRGAFRGVSALYSRYITMRMDLDGLYTVDGYISKLEYPLDYESLDYAAGRFKNVYEKYLKDSGGRVYLAVIPDKGQFMADGKAYPHIDYAELTDYLSSRMDYAEYIDISPTLELGDYYRTDSHWRQEKLPETASALCRAMGASLETAENAAYTVNTINKPFIGVYGSQSALPHKAEEIKYLTSPVLDGCSVFDYEVNDYIDIYDLEKGIGDDPYELFLSGPRSLQKISNPAASAEKKLVIFRDSFGSSIAPLLAEGYSEITLIDIRYLASDFLGMMVDFSGSDTLFLYSESVLNNSITLK